MSSSEVKQYKIIIQSVSSVKDGKGGWTDTWSDTMTAFAEKWQIKGADALEYMKMGHAEVWVYRIVAMRTVRVTPAMRIKEYEYIDGEYRYLDIIRVENRVEQREILITAKVADSVTS